ncbi:MAG: aminotransferase class V-fold PLP-dependent enzyme [Lachnospiraceae bacterium]|nr:aminotransferase class V-fold PLP-dependent enzyme [Lachnospiraceae bacterium]
MEQLYDKLREYAKGDDYPLHMPGHKRRTFGALPESLFSMDITEIPDFDDLHAPEGVLKELEERVAKLYGADESFVLVNGSTCGILSALSCALPEGGHLLMARNCHKSAYHAAYLRKLRLTYLMPPVLAGFGICDGISPKQVEEALAKDPTIQAVLIVSPTYEGRISPIREIAEVVHGHGKILIVDEAHGAHLGLTRRPAVEANGVGNAAGSRDVDEANGVGNAAGSRGAVPEGAAWHENSCRAGADLVIHSVHKTLPAMTQTALLHVNGDRVDRERLRRFLRIYQSSSPSYVLMASVDNAIAMIEQDGERLFHEFYENFTRMTDALSACKHFKILAVKREAGLGILAVKREVGLGILAVKREVGLGKGSDFADGGFASDTSLVALCKESSLTAVTSQDIGKLLIHAGDSGLTGQQIYDTLREKYHLQLEMAAGEYCLAMFTIGDTAEGFERTTKALLEMDRAVETRIGTEADAPVLHSSNPDIIMSLNEAWDAPYEEVPLSACEGHVAAEFVNLYPPGTPIVAPGEAFTKKIQEDILRAQAQGLSLRGVSKAGTVRVIINS